jgi:ABC-2 type transport system ATP-binding protein
LIDKGRVIADGSFEELKKQQGNSSLEQIFASLTANSSLDASTDELMKAMEN